MCIPIKYYKILHIPTEAFDVSVCKYCSDFYYKTKKMVKWMVDNIYTEQNRTRTKSDYGKNF